MQDYTRRRKRVARHERKRELAKAANPKCSVCGESRIEMLELDHTAGDANGELTNWLCRNHHAAVSDHWYDDAPELLLHGGPRDADSRLASLLQGVVYFLEELSAKLREWVDYLSSRSRFHQEQGSVDPFEAEEPR